MRNKTSSNKNSSINYDAKVLEDAEEVKMEEYVDDEY